MEEKNVVLEQIRKAQGNAQKANVLQGNWGGRIVSQNIRVDKDF